MNKLRKALDDLQKTADKAKENGIEISIEFEGENGPKKITL